MQQISKGNTHTEVWFAALLKSHAWVFYITISAYKNFLNFLFIRTPASGLWQIIKDQWIDSVNIDSGEMLMTLMATYFKN